MIDFNASWQRAWRNLRAAPESGLQQRLLDAWAEPQRHYHGLQHLAECLACFDEASALAERPGEVEIALWFHDAIYDPKAKDNERRSADWATASLRAAKFDEDAVTRVDALIMATCHSAQPESGDAQLLVDIDLSILGATPERFSEYDRQIREEYRWVPGFVYRFKRRNVMRGFLERPWIYSTARFRDRFEAQARRNLEAATR